MTASSSLSIDSAEFRRSQYARRSLLPSNQKYLWQIETGAVRTSTVLENGTTVTLGIWGVGDVVSQVLSKSDAYQMECLTPVEVTRIPFEQWHFVNEVLIRHIQQCQEFLEILHYRSIDVSLLRLLSFLSKKFGHEVKQGQLINLHLTHQEIAEIIGTTRVTVTRLLNEFEKQGIIERLSRKHIVVTEKQAFWHYEI